MTSPAAETGAETGLMRHGKLSYLQIPTKDALALSAFYANVFGWQVDGNPSHVSFQDASGDLIGAFMPDRTIANEAGFLPYMSVNNVNKALRQIEANGGTTVREPYPEGGLMVATFRDPDGNLLGIWQMAG